MSTKPKAKGAGGRPRMCATASELQERVDEYFRKNRARPTISGLALFLGYLDRQSIYNILEQKDEYSYIIRAAISKIEAKVEALLFRAAPTQGVMFWLRCHSNAKDKMGMWKDTSKVDVTSGGDKIQTSNVLVGTQAVVDALKASVDELNG